VARQLLAIKQLEDEVKVLKQIAAFDALNRRLPNMLVGGGGGNTPSTPSTPTTPARPITTASTTPFSRPIQPLSSTPVIVATPNIQSLTPGPNGGAPRSPRHHRPSSAPIVKDNAWEQPSNGVPGSGAIDGGVPSMEPSRDIDTIADVERAGDSVGGVNEMKVEEQKVFKVKANDGVATSITAFECAKQLPISSSLSHSCNSFTCMILNMNRSRRHNIPDMREMILHFICPLSKFVLVDPVLALDGFTYDRRAIEAFMQSHRVSPLTGKKMGGKLLIPNHNLKNQIRKYFPNAPQRQVVSPFQLIPITCINCKHTNLTIPLISSFPSLLPYSFSSHLLTFCIVVFGYMGHKQLCRSFQVCHEWRTVGEDDKLWRNLILHKFAEMTPVLASGDTYKQYYRGKLPIVKKRGRPVTTSYSVANRAIIGKVMNTFHCSALFLFCNYCSLLIDK
jgi:hypothetical protein